MAGCLWDVGWCHRKLKIPETPEVKPADTGGSQWSSVVVTNLSVCLFMCQQVACDVVTVYSGPELPCHVCLSQSICQSRLDLFFLSTFSLSPNHKRLNPTLWYIIFFLYSYFQFPTSHPLNRPEKSIANLEEVKCQDRQVLMSRSQADLEQMLPICK